MVLGAKIGTAEAAQLLASRGVPPVGSRKSLVGLSPSVVEVAPEAEIAIAGSSKFTPKPVREKAARWVPAQQQQQPRSLTTAGSLGSKKQLTWSQTVEGGLEAWEGSAVEPVEDGAQADTVQSPPWGDGGISLFFGDVGLGHAAGRLGSEAGTRQRAGRAPKKQGGGLKPLEVGGGAPPGTLGGRAHAGGTTVGDGLVGEHFGSPKIKGGREAEAQRAKGHAGRAEHGEAVVREQSGSPQIKGRAAEAHGAQGHAGGAEFGEAIARAGMARKGRLVLANASEGGPAVHVSARGAAERVAADGGGGTGATGLRAAAAAGGGGHQEGAAAGGQPEAASQQEGSSRSVVNLELLLALANEDMGYEGGSFRALYNAGPNMPNVFSSEEGHGRGGTPSTVLSEARQPTSAGASVASDTQWEGAQVTAADMAELSEGRQPTSAAASVGSDTQWEGTQVTASAMTADARRRSLQGSTPGSSRGGGLGASAERARSGGRSKAHEKSSAGPGRSRSRGSVHRERQATSWRDVMAGTAISTDEVAAAKSRQAASGPASGRSTGRRRSEGPRSPQPPRGEGAPPRGGGDLSVQGHRQRTGGFASGDGGALTASLQRSDGSGSARRHHTGGSAGARTSTTPGSERPLGTPGPGILRAPSGRSVREAGSGGSRGSSRGEGQAMPHTGRARAARTPTDRPGGGRPGTGRSSRSRSASVQGGASSRASSRSGDDDRQELSFLDLEGRWGMSLDKAPGRGRDTPRTRRAKYLIKNRVLMLSRRSNQDTGVRARTHVSRPRSLSPDSFKHNASLSRELLNSMVLARSPRHQAALQSYEEAVQEIKSQVAMDKGADAPSNTPSSSFKPSKRGRRRRGEAGRSVSAMELSSLGTSQGAATSPQKHGSQSPVHGHAGMGVRSPERAQSVATGAQERAEELMKQGSMPPLASPSKALKQRAQEAKRVLDLKSQAFGFLKDSAGHAWNLTGVPAPLAIPSEVPLQEIDNPIFCPNVGISRQPDRRIVKKKDLVPVDEKGIKLSDDEVQMLMEYYFPSVEERLKKHNHEKERVIEKYKEKSPRKVRGGFRSASADHFWTPNSVALARLQDARNNPYEQDRLRRVAEEEASKLTVHKRSTAAVNHIKQNLQNAFVPTKHSPILAQGGLSREVVLANEDARRRFIDDKRQRDLMLSMTLEEQMKARADKVKQLSAKEVWLQQRQILQRRWLAGIVCAVSLRIMLAPIHIRRRSTSLARVFFMATRTIQRWLRKVIWKKRQAIYERVKRVAWRVLLKIRINHKRRHCWVLKEFFGDCRQRGRAIMAMKNFRHQVLLLQRNIRSFLVNRRFRWMMLELQWANYERRRNRALRKEWRVAWAHMMSTISKVFRMPPARLRRDSNSKSIRWVSQMMDELIAKMPDNIKNIVVVKPAIRQLVLKDVKRDILQAYLKDLKDYRKRVAQIEENKVIKDIVVATFPALLNQDEGSMRSPELQFLMDSDKLPPWPQLVPLLKPAHLEDLIIHAQGIQREQEAARNSEIVALARAADVVTPEGDASESERASNDPSNLASSQSFKAYAVTRFEKIDENGQMDEQGQPISDEEL